MVVTRRSNYSPPPPALSTSNPHDDESLCSNNPSAADDDHTADDEDNNSRGIAEARACNVDAILASEEDTSDDDLSPTKESQKQTVPDPSNNPVQLTTSAQREISMWLSQISRMQEYYNWSDVGDEAKQNDSDGSVSRFSSSPASCDFDSGQPSDSMEVIDVDNEPEIPSSYRFNMVTVDSIAELVQPQYTCPDGILQDTTRYTTSASYQIVLQDWTIYVLDPVDDMMMLHLVEWENETGDETGWRVAYVYRWMEEARNYYTDTWRIRKTKNMMHLDCPRVPDDDM